jgi:hypothetical protein
MTGYGSAAEALGGGRSPSAAASLVFRLEC